MWRSSVARAGGFDRISKKEYFKFGPEEATVSYAPFHYPVGINGKMGSVLLAIVASYLPALLGPDEMLGLKVYLAFISGTMSAMDISSPTEYTSSGHPVLHLLDYRQRRNP